MVKRLGIIGAGQLGAYLCQTATPLEVETIALSPDGTSPASTVATRMLVADYDDAQALETLCQQSDVVTFEFEDVPDSALTYLENQSHARVYPLPQTIRLIKNKGLQKTWLRNNEFATSDFVLTEDQVSYEALAATLGPTFVQKALTGGIDGRGVQVIGENNADDLWQQATLAEAFVEHDLELAVLVSRNVSGQVKSYPVVELSFCPESNVLLVASSPARISSGIEQQAKALGEQVVTKMSGVGIFAIELFLTPKGELLVNEVSPRVHNSGHMTIEAHKTSQYEQHIRAVFDMDLLSQEQNLPVAMTNLLYTDSLHPLLGRSFSAWPHGEHSIIHWYGKLDGRQGRKMGHITTAAESLDDAIEEVTQVQNTLKEHVENEQ